MSRIGKKPILIPEGVEVTIEKNLVRIKGPKAELSQIIPAEVSLEIKDRKISVLSKAKDKKQRALWGTIRVLLANRIKGVTTGYEKKLEIEGLGYKAMLEGENLVLYCGFTHPVKINSIQRIKFSVDKNVITVSGFDKELVGSIAAKIRHIKPAEPYKGKGIKYLGEIIRRKAGKKVATGTGAA